MINSNLNSIASLLEKSGHKVLYIHCSLLQEQDVVGIPIPGKDGHGIDYIPSKMFPFKDAGGPETIVILKDYNDPLEEHLRDALSEIVNFRSIHGRPLNISAIIL